MENFISSPWTEKFPSPLRATYKRMNVVLAKQTCGTTCHKFAGRHNSFFFMILSLYSQDLCGVRKMIGITNPMLELCKIYHNHNSKDYLGEKKRHDFYPSFLYLKNLSDNSYYNWKEQELYKHKSWVWLLALHLLAMI